jgi:hypothetical protein
MVVKTKDGRIHRLPIVDDGVAQARVSRGRRLAA